MNKVITHLKNNFAIYSVLLVCIIIIGLSLLITHEEELPTVDTSMFKVVNLEETLGLFEQDKPVFLVIGYRTCSATISYASYLQIAQAKYGFQTYYLELDDIDKDNPEQIEIYNKLVEKLDYEYDLLNEKGKFGKFIGSTPMTIIINNKKQVFGYIGSMNTSTLESITKVYGVATIQ